jgi:hypothetical protein
MNKERTKISIESTFATVRLRTKVSQRPGSRAAGIAMAYKLIEPERQAVEASGTPGRAGHRAAGVLAHNLNATPIGPRGTWSRAM